MEKLIEFFKASYDELMNKVTWSNANELRSNTIIVLVGSVVIAFLILLMDKISMIALGDVIYKIIG